MWAPGTAFSYSTFGMALLGTVVTRLSGMRYRDYVSTQILAPLGMRSTFWDSRDVPKGRLATGYVPGAEAPIKDLPWRLGEAEAAGGLYTSLRDLARYAAFQLDAYPPRDDPEVGPVRRSSVREAHAIARHIGLSVRLREPSPDHPALVSARARGSGLAWHGFETCELEQIVGHMGILGGYSAGIEFYPQRGLALVSLSNHRDGPNRDLIWAARDILLESKGLAPRTRSLSPALRRAMAALVDLYGRFSEAKYQKVFATLYVDAFLAAEAGREAERLEKIHGRCKDRRRSRSATIRAAGSRPYASAAASSTTYRSTPTAGSSRVPSIRATSRRPLRLRARRRASPRSSSTGMTPLTTPCSRRHCRSPGCRRCSTSCVSCTRPARSARHSTATAARARWSPSIAKRKGPSGYLSRSPRPASE